MIRAITILYDDETGDDIKIEQTTAFHRESSTMRADVIQMALERLSKMYEEALTRLGKN